MEFVKSLRELLEANFEGAQVELDQEKPGGKVRGSLVWEGFDSIEPLDRQNRVRELLKTHYDTRRQRKVALLVTFTPREWKAIREHNLAED